MSRSPIMEFFKFDHLPPKMQEASKPFCELAEKVEAGETRHHAEKATALRKLLEAKDAAVRCLLPVLIAIIGLGALLAPAAALAAEVVTSPEAQWAADVVVVPEAPSGSPVLELVLKYIAPPLLTAIGGLLAWLLGLAVSYLKTKTETSKLAHVGLFLTEAARNVVAEVEATLVPMAKEAMADGKLTPEEGAKIKAAALELLKTKLPPALLLQAKGAFGPLLDTILGGLLERANAEQKVQTLEQAAEAFRKGPVPA